MQDYFLKEWLFPSDTYKFEGRELRVPYNYHAYLTQFYGDYMTPPPENKRGDRHKIIEVDLGGYAVNE